MHCKTVRNYREPYFDGLLHARISEAIDEHLARCSRCRHEFEVQREMRDALRDMPGVTRSPEFWSDLERSIHMKLSESRTPADFDENDYDRIPFFKFKYQLTAALLIMTFIISSIVWDVLRHPGDETQLVAGNGNGEEIEFYLEEHDLAKGSSAMTQSAFAGVVFQGSRDSKRSGGK